MIEDQCTCPNPFGKLSRHLRHRMTLLQCPLFHLFLRPPCQLTTRVSLKRDVRISRFMDEQGSIGTQRKDGWRIKGVTQDDEFPGGKQRLSEYVAYAGVCDFFVKRYIGNRNEGQAHPDAWSARHQPKSHIPFPYAHGHWWHLSKARPHQLSNLGLSPPNNVKRPPALCPYAPGGPWGHQCMGLKDREVLKARARRRCCSCACVLVLSFGGWKCVDLTGRIHGSCASERVRRRKTRETGHAYPWVACWNMWIGWQGWWQ